MVDYSKFHLSKNTPFGVTLAYTLRLCVSNGVHQLWLYLAAATMATGDGRQMTDDGDDGDDNDDDDVVTNDDADEYGNMIVMMTMSSGRAQQQ